MSKFFPPLGTARVWLLSAKPGSQFPYYTGSFLPSIGHETLIALRHAYNDGAIDLVQKRSGQEFIYMAIKRRNPPTTPFERFAPIFLDRKHIQGAR